MIQIDAVCFLPVELFRLCLLLNGSFLSYLDGKIFFYLFLNFWEFKIIRNRYFKIKFNVKLGEIKTLGRNLLQSKKTNFRSQCHVNCLLKSCFLVNIGLTVFNFPAKRLRKNTGAQNTHAPLFFKKIAILAVSYFPRQTL